QLSISSRLTLPRPRFSSSASAPPRALHSFPTRRSSDLEPGPRGCPRRCRTTRQRRVPPRPGRRARSERRPLELLTQVSKILEVEDRKSTRLNSSHGSISYAVFCLKKKKRRETQHIMHYT